VLCISTVPVRSSRGSGHFPAGRLSKLDKEESGMPRDAGASDLRRVLLVRPPVRDPRRHLLLPARGPVRRFSQSHVPGLLRARGRVLVVRGRATRKGRQQYDGRPPWEVRPGVLVACIATYFVGKLQKGNFQTDCMQSMGKNTNF